MWQYDSTMRGWRYSIVDGGVTFRTYAAYAALPSIEHDLREAIKQYRTGHNPGFVKVGPFLQMPAQL